MKTIRSQITRKLGLIFLMVIICGGVGIYFAIRAALLEQFDNALSARANLIVAASEWNNDHVEVELNEALLREFDDGVPVEFFQLWGAKGAALKRSESLGNRELAITFDASSRKKFWNVRLPSGNSGRAVAFTFVPQDGEGSRAAGSSPVTLEFASDCRDLDWTLRSLALALAVCGALMSAATAFVAPRVLRAEFAPLEQLAERATQIDAASLSIRFATEGLPGEIEPIAVRLNQLLARLEESFVRERQFSADLAHELRTPIAELRSVAEVALKWPDSRTPETDRDALEIAVQMEAIVSKLLELMRSERGQIPIQPEAIHFAPFLQTVLRPFKTRIEQKKLALRINVPESLRIETDPALLRSILANLVDNAVEYSPDNSDIALETANSAREFTFRISNTTRGVEAADVPRFFDRLWRKDPARSWSPHVGLGLPLARSFALLLGADLTASWEAGSRILLTLRMPDRARVSSAPGAAA
jgi:two-component system sensor histidine kinase QseC